MLAPIIASQDLPLSPPVSVSEICYSEKDTSAPTMNGMKLVSFADLLDEQLVSPALSCTAMPSLIARFSHHLLLRLLKSSKLTNEKERGTWKH